MANIIGTFRAVERYPLVKDPVAGGLDPAVPDEIDVLHAGVLGPEPWTGLREQIADATEPIYLFGGSVFQVACGRYVTVLIPKPFDSEHPIGVPAVHGGPGRCRISQQPGVVSCWSAPSVGTA